MKYLCLLVLGVISILMLGCSLEGNSCHYNVDKSLNEYRCKDTNTAKECQADGLWAEVKCDFGCNNLTGQCNECASTLRTCLGISWKEETCEFTCEGVNGNAKCKCKPGVIYCVYTTGAQRCKEDGTWEDMSCPGGCSGGKCSL